ncbi:MAG: hypothetical protein WDO74_31615 [Pseudomonadota bacterium]
MFASTDYDRSVRDIPCGGYSAQLPAARAPIVECAKGWAIAIQHRTSQRAG